MIISQQLLIRRFYSLDYLVIDFLNYQNDGFWPVDGGSIDGHFVSADDKDLAGVFNRADAAAE